MGSGSGQESGDSNKNYAFAPGFDEAQHQRNVALLEGTARGQGLRPLYEAAVWEHPELSRVELASAPDGTPAHEIAQALSMWNPANRSGRHQVRVQLDRGFKPLWFIGMYLEPLTPWYREMFESAGIDPMAILPGNIFRLLFLHELGRVAYGFGAHGELYDAGRAAAMLYEKHAPTVVVTESRARHDTQPQPLRESSLPIPGLTPFQAAIMPEADFRLAAVKAATWTRFRGDVMGRGALVMQQGIEYGVLPAELEAGRFVAKVFRRHPELYANFPSG